MRHYDWGPKNEDLERFAEAADTLAIAVDVGDADRIALALRTFKSARAPLAALGRLPPWFDIARGPGKK